MKYSCTILDQISTLNIDKSNITTQFHLVPMSGSIFGCCNKYCHLVCDAKKCCHL